MDIFLEDISQENKSQEMINSSKIVQEGNIVIGKELWKQLNESMDKEEIKKLISSAIDEHEIPMPMKVIELDDAVESFKSMTETSFEDLVVEEKWFTRYEYSDKFPLSDILFKSNTVGNRASDFFMQENRWKCDSINSPSPYRSWTIEKFRLTLFNAIWSLKLEEVNMAKLRSCIGLRKYIASQFRPATAMAVYDLFQAKNVLDFSSGWGDRLVGFMASQAESYVGIDPNSNLFPEYKKMIDLYNVDGKSIEMVEGCAEDVDLQEKTFDLIFTSPPYFTVERYTQEENQSWKKFKNLDQWLDGFMFPVLDKCWEHLEKGGHLAINISDCYAKHTINEICDPMNEYLSKKEGSVYVGCYGYEMKKRPNSGALKGKEGKFAEPMWVWQKI